MPENEEKVELGVLYVPEYVMYSNTNFVVHPVLVITNTVTEGRKIRNVHGRYVGEPFPAYPLITQKYTLDGLDLRASVPSPDRLDDPIWFLDGPTIEHSGGVKLHVAEEMVATLRHVGRAMDRIKYTCGNAQDFAQFAGYFAQALKAKWFVFYKQNGEIPRFRGYDEQEFKFLNIGEGVEELRWRLKAWKQRQEELAA